jgi:hypothetical protein
MTSAIIPEEVKPLANSVVKDIEEVVREVEREEERPVLYYTSPMPGVRYYSLKPTKLAR